MSEAGCKDDVGLRIRHLLIIFIFTMEPFRNSRLKGATMWCIRNRYIVSPLGLVNQVPHALETEPFMIR